ncbi:MAG: SDR family oxidoreductase [Promethearchaeota archaeon]
MTFQKILIIGANGFLGNNILFFQNVYDLKEQKFSFIAADLNNSNVDENIPFHYIDITKSDDTIKKIKKINPDVVLLTAAMTDVDYSEINKELATKTNSEGPKNVLNACENIDSKFVLISTDFVFDGTKVGLYTENDNPNPINHYGKTKYEAELTLINSNIDYLICRTAVLYGWSKDKLNFITWLINKLEHKEKISIVTNQINNPTFGRNLAEILLKLIEKDASGIFHTAGSDALDRYTIALKTAEIFNLNKDLINPISGFEQKATRPKNVGLDISKLERFIGDELKIFNLNDGLNYMKKHRIQ